MSEIGIDISIYVAKNMMKFKDNEFDYVVTLCGDEEGTYPFFPGTSKKTIHQGFRDPNAFEGTDQEKTDAFRKIRDEIRDWIKETF